MDSAAADRRRILDLHAQDRRAHLVGDADLLTQGMADFVWEANRGTLNRIPRGEIRERFRAYFESVRYSLWDDLQPPHVSIAGDGLNAWMAVHIEARLAAVDGSGEERAFESAWIATYQRIDDRWQMVGISSSVVDRTSRAEGGSA